MTLTDLTETERQILMLLAQGHTIKSISEETGLAQHTVNDRLREARRKTGTSSSRVLARQLMEALSQSGAISQAPQAQGNARRWRYRPGHGLIGPLLVGAFCLLIWVLVEQKLDRSRPKREPIQSPGSTHAPRWGKP